jgi:glycosyltransferase involved in cell wall biosynthesis
VELTRWTGVQFSASIHLLPSLIRVMRSFKPQVVHAHNLFFRTTEAAALVRLVSRVPLVTTLHLGPVEGGHRLLRILTRGYEATMGRFIARRSSHLIAVSQAVAHHAQRLGGGGKGVTVIPNGVDPRTFSPNGKHVEGGSTVLFVGRLVPNKGPKTLLSSIPLVLKRHPQARFLIAGDGPMRSKLEGEARRLGVDGAVEFLGTRRDVPDLMRRADVFVRPSFMEGMPLTVLEAMASGLPVVATPVGGTPELLEDGIHGRLFPVGDQVALADSLTGILNDSEGGREMGRRGRALVEHSYPWDRVVEETEAVYNQVVSR